MNYPAFYSRLLAEAAGIEILFAEPLAKHTTWRIGGPAEYFCRPQTLLDCRKVLNIAWEERVPVTILGSGSNTLISDEGIKGLVMKTTRLRELSWENNVVTVGAGVALRNLSRQAGEKGLTGLEFAIGIPGTLGGAVIMNAGAHGQSVGESVQEVKTITPAGEVQSYSVEELNFSYRNSALKHGEELLVEAVLSLKPGNSQTINEMMNRFISIRQEKQPLQYPNAGSVFRNPPGDSAGRLIEAVGAKGWRIGDAQISHQHANFIVNLGQAKARDVLTIIKEVQKAVQEEYSICLETEVILLGFGK